MGTNATAWHAAFSLAALVFYAPANLYPILKVDMDGAHSETTVWQGCRARWRRGRTWIYRSVEVMGPWAMLGVFLVAVLVALVKLGQRARPVADDLG